MSAEAQQFLASGMQLRSESGPTPDPTDVEAWRALIEVANDGVAMMFDARTQGSEASVVTRSVDGVPVHVVTPPGADDDPDPAIYLEVHGGAFTMGYGDACRAMAKHAAARVQMRTWAVDYRTPPDHPYPAPLDDCVAVYRRLVEERGADRIVVGGESAGGNLAAALVLRARDEGLPLPAALVLLSPEADLTESGDSFATILGIDPVLTESLAPSIALYAAGHDLTDPYLSPLFGDLAPPFPPTLLQAGTRDLFLSNAVRMHRKLRANGVDAELHVFEAMPHGGFFGAPEDDELADEVRRFLRAHVSVTRDDAKGSR